MYVILHKYMYNICIQCTHVNRYHIYTHVHMYTTTHVHGVHNNILWSALLWLPQHKRTFVICQFFYLQSFQRSNKISHLCSQWRLSRAPLCLKRWMQNPGSMRPTLVSICLSAFDFIWIYAKSNTMVESFNLKCSCWPNFMLAIRYNCFRLS